MDKKTNAKVINNMAEKIEKLEKINLLNAERNIKNMEHFEKMSDIMEMCEIADKRIDKVSEMADNINERCNVLTNFDEKILNCLEIIDERIHHLKSDIKELAKNDIELDDNMKVLEGNGALDLNRIESLEDNIDDLEAKNYQIKSDLDKLINGDETITLGELREFKNWEEFNETMREGHETIKRVKARNGENNE